MKAPGISSEEIGAEYTLETVPLEGLQATVAGSVPYGDYSEYAGFVGEIQSIAQRLLKERTR